MYLVGASVVALLHLGPAGPTDRLLHGTLLPSGCNGLDFVALSRDYAALDSTLFVRVPAFK